MKIYHPGQRGKNTTFVSPGVHHPQVDWMDEQGKPRMLAVTFAEGVADVDERLGQYMIDRDLAKASPIILLDEVMA